MERTKFQLRITKTELNFIKKSLEKKGINISKFIRDSIRQCLMDIVKDKKEDTELLNNFVREEQLKLQRKLNKERKHNLYFIRNWLKVLYLIAQSLLVNSQGHNINIKILRDLVKQAKKEFKLLPSDIRTLLRKDVKLLDSWGNEKFVMERMNYLKAVSPIVKMELLENKNR